MKRLLTVLLCLIATLAPNYAWAQAVSYPPEVFELFVDSNAKISAHCQKNGIPKAEERNSIKPLIVIPECSEMEHLAEMVAMAGGDHVVAHVDDNPPIELWTLASAWDGALMPEGWVTKDDDYSVLFYKSVSERNIPHLGRSSLSEKIDRGLKRMPEGFSSIEDLVKKARLFHKAKVLMGEILSIDTHCDLPEIFSAGASVGRRSTTQCSVPKMTEGHLDSQVLISFLWQGPTDGNSLNKAAEKNFRQIEEIKADIAKYPLICGLASNPEEAIDLKKQGKKSFFIGIENGYGIGNDLGNIKKARDLGVIYITLCHFRDNHICNTSSKHGGNPSNGLTEFGKKVVEEMNRQGLMIDLSHPSPGTFWDCIKYSKAPIICSHSGAKAIYGHDRGLDDRQLKALAENGGVIQVYSVPEFLTRNQYSSSIDDMMAHFNHCVEVAGPEHVGIGSDFDGGGGVLGCNGDNDLINLTVKMLEHGYSPSQIEGFWGGNFMRVMKEVQSIPNQD